MQRKFFLALLDTAAAHAQRSREGFQKIGLTEGQPKILYILRAEEGYSQKELARRCKVKEPTMTAMLKKLEVKSLIERRRIETESGKWAYGVFLTKAGRKKADEVQAFVETLEEQSFAGFSGAEKKQLFHMLDRIIDNLGISGEICNRACAGGGGAAAHIRRDDG